MKRVSRAYRVVMLAMACLVLPLAMPGLVGAQATTIYAEIGGCRWSVQHYQVQFQSGVFGAPARDFPATVDITFTDGTVAQGTTLLGPNGGTQTYRLEDPNGVYREKTVASVTAQFDTTKYPNYRFTLVTYPCDPTPTHTVSGQILQQGNLKPVGGLTVCLAELGICTVTADDGTFTFTDVEDGTYTLTSDGLVYKPLSTTVTVANGDVWLDLIQQRGGGR